MAPITRSSRQGNPSSFSERTPFSAATLSKSDRYSQDENMVDDYEEELFEQESPFQSSAQDILRPLQDTADRVSRQVEEFAKTLDLFVADRDPSDQTLWNDAFALLENYSNIALNRLKRTASHESDVQVQKIQLECDLWILIRNLLLTNSPDLMREASAAQGSRLGDLHRYSKNADIWEAFLDSDILAQDYECILSWLQEREVTTAPPLEEVVRLLSPRSNSSEGVWSAGPLYTQTAIKRQKRSRLTSEPLDPSLPSLKNDHVRGDGRALVTQLDPDAPTRQSASLQEQDENHEQTAWRTYWEMLRRGQKPSSVAEWWAERKESWRHAALNVGGPATPNLVDSPWQRIYGIASNPEWLDVCERLSREGSLDKYQRAVYGILVGNLSSSTAVSETIDDQLFSIFNAYLIERYAAYWSAFKRRVSGSELLEYHPPQFADKALKTFSRKALSNEEARQPHKFLQLAAVTKDFNTFLLEMGVAAAHTAQTSDVGVRLIDESTAEGSEIARINAQDPDTIRIVAHLQLALQCLGLLDPSFAQNQYEMENNIVNYIGWLETQGKYSLIPLYVSKLSADRGEHVLATILVNVTDDAERRQQVRLINQFNINISAVAYGVFTLANMDALQRLRSGGGPPTAPRIVEQGGASKTAMLKIRSGLMEGEITEEDERAIQSVEWFRHTEADQWGTAAWSVAMLYKSFLFDGKFAALRLLSERTELSQYSLDAVGMNLMLVEGDAIPRDLSYKDEDEDEDAGEDEERFHPISPSRKRKPSAQEHILTRQGTDREMLASKSLIWKELEQLTAAIYALDNFQGFVDSISE
ncbi:hypothetical protein, variant [Exophiala mesophila]|nr:hypothetical protein, variant [Exophiala mesophila]KIV88343.1 hypothetical protein, variant [Exophiala mesophila]